MTDAGGLQHSVAVLEAPGIAWLCWRPRHGLAGVQVQVFSPPVGDLWSAQTQTAARWQMHREGQAAGAHHRLRV